MDRDRFDRLTRLCAARQPRRAAFGLVAAALGGVLPLTAREAAAAKCSKKKPCPACKLCKKGKCKKQKDGSACAGGVCADGVCACPEGQKPCGTGCVPTGDCCADGDCGTNERCCSGVCVNIATVAHCGSCDNACPAATTTSDAACVSGNCKMTCRGDNYDVDGDPGNGCEQLDTGGGHTQQTAVSRGAKSCNDTASQGSFSGTILSDGRAHANPAVTGFNSVTGSAPDWWSVDATGGSCVNDLAATITTSGGGPSGSCYKLTIITDKATESATISGDDATGATVAADYSEDKTIYFKIEKICNLPVQEAVSYTVSYHL
ncbi:MAG TPA: hypothetical protein VFU81_00840 [Thermomicrobiales bacterium]|nr:hypothetical protein [Thermomicrobiales bacterium]